jgi:uncharacterized protein (DUF2236 family)
VRNPLGELDASRLLAPAGAVLDLADEALEPVRSGIASSVRAVFRSDDDGDPLEPFRQPIGDPGWFGPDSVTWRVHEEFGALFVGGVAALMLQALHPLALAGVEEHSSYREDPRGRLLRTGAFVGAVTFGPTAMAEQNVAMVSKMHSRVVGIAPDGRPYAATDPELLTWVHASEYAMFLAAYQRYGPSRLSDSDADRYLDEVAVVAMQLGASWVPHTTDEMDAYLQRVQRDLYCGPQARTAFEFLTAGARADAATTAAYRLIATAALDLLPPWAREMAGRRDLLPHEQLAVRTATRGLVNTLRWALGPGDLVATARSRANGGSPGATAAPAA